VGADLATAGPPRVADRGRSRAGNAMARTRLAVLAGARTCILRQGTRKTTMVEIAATAGVAKATLYNHFRAKGEVFVALAAAEVDAAITEAHETATASGTVTALVRLAGRLGEHPVVRVLARDEPGTLGVLLLPGAAPDPAWGSARRGVATLLPAADPEAVETLLRWLVSQLLWPSPQAEAAWAVQRLLAASAGPPPDGTPDSATWSADEAALRGATGLPGAVARAGGGASVSVPGSWPGPWLGAPAPGATTRAQTVPGLGFPSGELLSAR